MKGEEGLREEGRKEGGRAMHFEEEEVISNRGITGRNPLAFLLLLLLLLFR